MKSASNSFLVEQRTVDSFATKDGSLLMAIGISARAARAARLSDAFIFAGFVTGFAASRRRS